MSRRFTGADEARKVDVGALGAAMSTMRGGFAELGGQGLARDDATTGPVHFSPAPGPKHFRPADPSVNPTAGWDPFDPLGEKAKVDPGEAHDALAAARADGFAAGLKAAEQMAASSNEGFAALDRLAAALERTGGFDREALAGRLRQTVLYLVTRLVGEVGISGDLLERRIAAAVDLLADASEPALLRLNPADLELVEGRFPDRIFAIADKGIERGGFLIETKSTVIEDGPSAWLSQLAAAIDRAPLPDAA